MSKQLRKKTEMKIKGKKLNKNRKQTDHDQAVHPD